MASRAIGAHVDPYVNHGGESPGLEDPLDTTEASRFLYPPTSLLLIRPLGFFRYPPTKLCFDALTLAILITTLLYLKRRYNPADLWVLLVFLSLPVMATIQRGQIDVMVLALLLLGYFATPLVAGIALGLAIGLKAYPVIVLLFFLTIKRWATVAAASVTAALMGVLALALWGKASYNEWAHNLFARTSPTVYLHSFSHIVQNHYIDSPDGLFTLDQKFVGTFSNPLLWAHSLALPLGLAFIVAYMWFSRRIERDLAYLGLISFLLFANRILWTMGMVMCIPIVLALLTRTKSRLEQLGLVLPFFLPAELSYHGMSPRFVLLSLTIIVIFARLRRTDGDLAAKPLTPLEIE